MMCSQGVMLLLAFLALTALPTSYGILNLGSPMTLTSQFLSREEVLRTVEALEAGESNEAGDVMMTETRSIEGQTLLKLRSEKREINMRLEPSYRLIKPNARLTYTNGDEERESFIDPLVRSSLYHGFVEGSPSSSASLVRNNDGWNGMIMTSTERFILHGVTGSSRSLLIPMSSEAEHLHKDSSFYDMMSGDEMFNMTGDEVFSKNREEVFNMNRDESLYSHKSEFELEVGVYTDKALYDFVKQKYPNDDTALKVQEVVFITLNTVHTFYQKSSLGKAKIAIVVAKLCIVDKEDPPGLTAVMKIETYLDNFCDWDAENMNPRGENYDFGLLFSGLDMYEDTPSDTATAGMAPVSRTCLFNTKRSCAIGEAIGFGSGIIMAHEIGHNLGMNHDGDGNTCAAEGYIMGAVISAGATQFSACSREYLQAYIQELDEFGDNCMRNEGNSPYEHSEAGKLPGERLAEGEQCRYTLGEGYSEYTIRSDFCSTLWCRKGNSLTSPNGGPPLPGTPCGENKICYNGKCSDKSNVTAEIKADTLTKSDSKGSVLSMDALCVKYAPKYPKALTYELSQEGDVYYGDLSGICSEGMKCFKNEYVMLLNHVALPGTSCGPGKTCKDEECVDDGSGGSSSAVSSIPVEGAITDSQLDIVNGICAQIKGNDWEAFCTVSNIKLFPEHISYCPGEVCGLNLCVRKTGSEIKLNSAYATDGTSCGEGKTCSYQQCA